MQINQQTLIVLITLNCLWHCFRAPLSARPYLKHIGLRSTIASIIASLADIQVTFSSHCLNVNILKCRDAVLLVTFEILYGNTYFSLAVCNDAKQVITCLQCFDAVGWAAGRASGL